MKRIFTICLLSAFCVLPVLAQDDTELKSYTVNVPVPGIFGREILSKAGELTEVEDLTITGTLNDDDWAILAKLTNLVRLDLSQLDITKVGYCSGLEYLKTVVLPESVTTVINSAFVGCSSLSTIDLPNATSIGDYAFYGCSSLSTIDLPNATSIGRAAFNGCSSLEIITLSPKLKSVYLSSQLHCIIICPAAVPPMATDISDGSKITLYVPRFSLADYKLASGWYACGTILPLDETVDAIDIYRSFVLTDTAGLSIPVDMNIVGYEGQTGQLTVSAGTPLEVGNFAMEGTRYYYYNTYNNSLIVNSPVSAETIDVSTYVANDKWYFISFPFDINVSDITVPTGTQWVVRKYSGADRAASTGTTWQNVGKSETMQAGEGYIFRCRNNSEHTVNFHAANTTNKNNIFTTQDVTTPLAEYASTLKTNTSWNLVGNPYPCFFNVTYIDFTAPITVWNGSSYTAISLTDDSYSLKPFEAFFVQRPDDVDAILFHKEGRSHEDVSSSSAPRRAPQEAHTSQRSLYDLTLRCADMSDRARIVINNEASAEYNINTDAAKMMSDDAVPQIYINDGGLHYAIDERPMQGATPAVGVRLPTDDTYVLSLSRRPEGCESFVVLDTETGIRVNLAKDEYIFNGAMGENECRFRIQSVGDDASVITSVDSENQAAEGVYDLNGRYVGFESEGLHAGMYIVKKGTSVRKLIIK